MQKEEKLEKFRNSRTSKRRKHRVDKEVRKEATKEKMLKLRNVYERKTQKRNEASQFAIKTEEKTFS